MTVFFVFTFGCLIGYFLGWLTVADNVRASKAQLWDLIRSKVESDRERYLDEASRLSQSSVLPEIIAAELARTEAAALQRLIPWIDAQRKR